MGRELVEESSRQRPENRRVRARKFSSIRRGLGDTNGTLADVFTSNDEEWPFKIVNFHRARANTAMIDERSRTYWARDTVEDERLWVPI